jgi:hypothetical protein
MKLAQINTLVSVLASVVEFAPGKKRRGVRNMVCPSYSNK